MLRWSINASYSYSPVLTFTFHSRFYSRVSCLCSVPHHRIFYSLSPLSLSSPLLPLFLSPHLFTLPSLLSLSLSFSSFLSPFSLSFSVFPYLFFFLPNLLLLHLFPLPFLLATFTEILFVRQLVGNVNGLLSNPYGREGLRGEKMGRKKIFWEN